MEADVKRCATARPVSSRWASPRSSRADDRSDQRVAVRASQASIQIPITRIGSHTAEAHRARGRRVQGIAWDEAIAELTERLDGLAAGDQKSLAFLTRPAQPRLALAAEFLAKSAPRANHLRSVRRRVLRRANDISFGHAQLPTLDLARSRFVVSFGADFLGTWNSPLPERRVRRDAPGHPVSAARSCRSSRACPDRANADQWVPVKPGPKACWRSDWRA